MGNTESLPAPPRTPPSMWACGGEGLRGREGVSPWQYQHHPNATSSRRYGYLEALGCPGSGSRDGPPVAPPTGPEASLPTSRGSSLSSQGSWYDSPWGEGGAGLGDATPLPLPPGTAHTSCLSNRTEDSGMGDSMILPPSSPPSPPTPLQPAGAGGGAGPRYSAHTLPCSRAEPVTVAAGNSRKDFLKSRIRQLSDWTGSLSRKKRRVQEPHSSQGGDVITGGPDITRATPPGTLWSCNPLLGHAPFSFSGHAPRGSVGPAPRQDVYQNFMQELEGAGPSDREGEAEESSAGSEEHLDLLCEGGEEQGAVRRAGWLSFKPLLAATKDRRLEPVARRRWKRYWVILKGCSLLLYETYGRSTERDEPCHVLPVQDAMATPVPEHPRREAVFCLSSACGDVMHFQACGQTDLEDWVTALHSSCAALLARRKGRDDTLRLLQEQTRLLLDELDMDNKMKKMAALQLSIISDPGNRRAVESQVQQWQRSTERLSVEVFRLRCYQASLQGGELPNPKGLLAAAARPSKACLGRLGAFSVSSLHALVVMRDNATLRRRRHSLSSRQQRRLVPALHTHIQDQLDPERACERSGAGGRAQCMPVGGSVALKEPDMFSVELHREGARDYGFAVTGHVDGEGRSHVFVSEVTPLGLACRRGLQAGDQVLTVNGAWVDRLDLGLLHALLCPPTLLLLLRREETPPQPDPLEPLEPSLAWAHPGMPPPPLWTTEGDAAECSTCCEDGERLTENPDRVCALYQTFPECTSADVDLPRNPYCQRDPSVSQKHLSVSQRLCKVIQELVDTETSYVKDLASLFDLYLTPLQQETFLSKEEMEGVFGSLPEMLDFQRVFLHTLEGQLSSCPSLSSLDSPQQFTKLLSSLGESFLYYADHFKLYSGFCANHVKVQKVLGRAKTDMAFKAFLDTRNPTNQHSSSLESYLIKPVQRVLKYPLLLRELVSITPVDSVEHTHLTEALWAMERVASHINEMQKIYEEFGPVFDLLALEHNTPDNEVTEVSMGDFLVHSSVVWLNPKPCLGRLRKDPELTLFVFKRAVILVQRDNTKLKRRMHTGTRDPFRFRWLVPVSALQIRPASASGPGEPCAWQLVHGRSVLQGRPETVFLLRSMTVDNKLQVLGALRTLLRERPPRDPPRGGRRREEHPLVEEVEECLQGDTVGRGGPLLHDLEVQLRRLQVGEQRAGESLELHSLVSVGNDAIPSL